MTRIIVSLVAVGCVAGGVVHGQSTGARPGALPDWSGTWQMIGPTVFDTATVQPRNGEPASPASGSLRRTTPSTRRSTRSTSP